MNSIPGCSMRRQAVSISMSNIHQRRAEAERMGCNQHVQRGYHCAAPLQAGGISFQPLAFLLRFRLLALEFQAGLELLQTLKGIFNTLDRRAEYPDTGMARGRI